MYSFLWPYSRHKFSFKSIPCIYLGTSPSHHAHHCLDPTSKRVYLARHVKFVPSRFLGSHLSKPKGSHIPTTLWLSITNHIPYCLGPSDDLGIILSNTISSAEFNSPTNTLSVPNQTPKPQTKSNHTPLLVLSASPTNQIVSYNP